ncbi:MAG: D-glycero-beta-D-manno-heptose 1,7-bisphosphate 7-phosphatase [Burkholderiales bacterium]|nr:MAG: D-glycero-beta-D-manno-heptose 1,7-bisphosphate 7-phosphatase [Burkholderiales bacterium]
MKLILIDRDGVINHDSEFFIKNPDEWQPIEGSLEALARLNAAGFRVAVTTNQSGVARGLLDVPMLHRIHAKMHRAAAAVGARIDAVFFCPHGPDDGCECRKPRPGMLREALTRFGAEPDATFVVGDSPRDLDAAVAAGCRPVLVLTGNGRRTLDEAQVPGQAIVRVDLAALATELCA